MISFKKYPKIHRLGKEETVGILIGTVHVEEKIDGANAQIWMKDGKIVCGSRNNTLTSDVNNPQEGDNMFNGFVEWCAESEAVAKFFKYHPTMRLYGEWLVKHTISYSELSYKKFYLFDIARATGDNTEEEFLEKAEVLNTAEEYGFITPHYYGGYEDPPLAELKALVGKSFLGVKGEGIVLKNPEYRDKFGSLTYAKIVSPEFTENNGIVFGGNNKNSDSYWEMYITNKYITLARVKKVMQKLQPIIDKPLDLEHIPRISNTVYHDMITEEIWEIQKKARAVDLRILSRYCTKKAIQIYKDILLDDISVADKE